MNRDKLIRIIGFIVFLVSVLIYINIATGRIAAFTLGVFTGLSFLTIFVGERILGKIK